MRKTDAEREADLNYQYYDDAPIDSGLPGGITDRDPHFSDGDFEPKQEPVPEVEDKQAYLVKLKEKMAQPGWWNNYTPR